METLQDVKNYRRERDGMFKQLADTAYQSAEHREIMNRIRLFDEQHDHLVEEGGLVHAESFNFHDIIKKVEHVPADLGIDPHKIIDTIRGELQHVLQETAAPVAKKAFQTSAAFAEALYHDFQALEQEDPGLIDDINKVSIPASLSIINLEYDRFYGRAKGLTRLLMEQSQHFQFNRHSIRWVISNTGPSKIGVNMSGEVFTSLLSFSIGVNMPLSLAVRAVDLALEKAGLAE